MSTHSGRHDHECSRARSAPPTAAAAAGARPRGGTSRRASSTSAAASRASARRAARARRPRTPSGGTAPPTAARSGSAVPTISFCSTHSRVSALHAVFTPSMLRPFPPRDQRESDRGRVKLGFMLDPRRLLVLRAVVRAGSMSAAAAELGYTPSAVSQQVATLEREVRTPLLVRHSRGVVPTEAGSLLVEHADVVVRPARPRAGGGGRPHRAAGRPAAARGLRQRGRPTAAGGDRRVPPPPSRGAALPGAARARGVPRPGARGRAGPRDHVRLPRRDPERARRSPPGRPSTPRA